MGTQTSRAVLIFLLASSVLSAFPSAAAANNVTAETMARKPVRRVDSPSLVVELVPMPARYQILGGDLLHLFTASANSVFRVGPIDTLDFVGVEPATYRVQVGDSSRPESGIYLFQYKYGGEVIDEVKVDIRDPR